jgi:hypothetical protein
MTLIKEFLDSRHQCIICNTKLQLKAYVIELFTPPVLSLFEGYLTIKSNHFELHINTFNNNITFISGNVKCHWSIKLILFCPNHNFKDSYEHYECLLCFDVYNESIINTYVEEVLMTENFNLRSLPNENKIRYHEFNHKCLEFPYFDYSKMSVEKLKNKLKTYLIMQ